MTTTAPEITCLHCNDTGEETVRDDGYSLITNCRWCPAGDWQPKDDRDDERGHR